MILHFSPTIHSSLQSRMESTYSYTETNTRIRTMLFRAPFDPVSLPLRNKTLRYWTDAADELDPFVIGPSPKMASPDPR